MFWDQDASDAEAEREYMERDATFNAWEEAQYVATGQQEREDAEAEAEWERRVAEAERRADHRDDEEHAAEYRFMQVFGD
jgi:hypothetical protein